MCMFVLLLIIPQKSVMQFWIVNQNNGSRIRNEAQRKIWFENKMEPRLYRDTYSRKMSTIVNTGYFKLELWIKSFVINQKKMEKLD